MTRRPPTGRLSAPEAGKRQHPAHLAPRRPGLSGLCDLTGLPDLSDLSTLSRPVSTVGSSLGRFGLAAVLGTALAAAGQLPAEAAPAAPSVASTPLAAIAPASAAAAPKAAPSAAAVKAAATARAVARRAKAIRIAKQYVGVPYRWGGTTPRGFDCSGYTRYVWKKAGKTLPRTSRAQYAKVRKISRAKARPGDLVFFKSSSGRVFHVGIYAGKNRMYDAPRPGKRVALRKIWSSRVSFGRV